ncbi:MAG TPA: hypothetical protein VGG33_27925 [Polyangia bacterium]
MRSPSSRAFLQGLAATVGALAASLALAQSPTPTPDNKNGTAASPPASPGSAPTAAPASPAPGTPAPSPATLERLRAEHAAIKDALFRSRARRDTLETALLSTQLQTAITWEGGRRYSLKAAELRLDGVRLWNTTEAPPGDQPVLLAPRGVAAGTHVLGVRIEVRSRDNPKLGYTSEQTFTVVLPEGKKTSVEVTVDEDGDLPGYNPDIEVEITQR